MPLSRSVPPQEIKPYLEDRNFVFYPRLVFMRQRVATLLIFQSDDRTN